MPTHSISFQLLALYMAYPEPTSLAVRIMTAASLSVRRPVFRFGFLAYQAQHLGHVWTVVGQPDGTFLWLQSYIQEYTLGDWMAHSKARGLNPMNLTEVRRRVAGLKALERPRPTGWDAELDALYHEMFHVRVGAKINLGFLQSILANYRGGIVHYDFACEWPLPKNA